MAAESRQYFRRQAVLQEAEDWQYIWQQRAGYSSGSRGSAVHPAAAGWQYFRQDSVQLTEFFIFRKESVQSTVDTGHHLQAGFQFSMEYYVWKRSQLALHNGNRHGILWMKTEPIGLI